MIVLDSVIRANKKCYPQKSLEECKYQITKNEMENLINDDLDTSSSDDLIMDQIMRLMINFDNGFDDFMKVRIVF